MPGWDYEKGWKEVRYRIRDPGQYRRCSSKVLTRDPHEVRAIVCWKPGAKASEIQALRFPISAGWTPATAKRWLSAHRDLTR